MKAFRFFVFSFLVLSVFFPMQKLQADTLPTISVAALPGLNRLGHLFDAPGAPHGVFEFERSEYTFHYKGEVPGVEVQITIVRKEYWEEEDDVYLKDNYSLSQIHFGKGEKTKIFITGIGGMVAPTCAELPSLSNDIVFSLVKLVGIPGVDDTKGSIGSDDTARVKVIFDPELIDKCK